MIDEKVHELMHKPVTDRLDKLEEQVETINAPEKGTLALMNQSLEAKFNKLDTKINYLFIILFSALGTIAWALIQNKIGLR